MDLQRLKYLILICAGLTILLVNCNKNTGSITPDYIPMSVGDIKQFIDLSDSSTIQTEITGKAYRSDGKEVFVETYQEGNATPRTNYYYNDGDFLISCNGLDTSIDTAGNKFITNPYIEQRIALKIPKQNQHWFQYADDTTRLLRISKLLGAMQTTVGSFENVFGFELYDSTTNLLPFMTNCYADKLGLIATLVDNKIDSVLAMLVYIHTATLERGSLLPKKDPIISLSKSRKTNLKKAHILLQGTYCR